MTESRKSRWYFCPYCGKKLLRYSFGARASGFFIKCRHCGKEIEVRLQGD